MFKLSDRVKQTSSTTGTSNLVLDGSLSGFQTFQQGIGDGNTTFYAIENYEKFEIGIGTYTSSTNTLSRDTILLSSNSNNKVDLQGVSTVFVTYPADKTVALDENGFITGFDADYAGIKFPDGTTQATAGGGDSSGDTNYYVNEATFDTTTNTLTLGRITPLQDLTVDLSGFSIPKSGDWNEAYDAVSAASGTWNDTASLVSTSGDAWAEAYSWGDHSEQGYLDEINIPESGNWNKAYEVVLAASGNWNDAYDKVQESGVKWSETYSTVHASGDKWAETYNTVQASGDFWTEAYNWGDHAEEGYLTTELNDLTDAVVWANVPDGNITETSVVQHSGAMRITESQIVDLQNYLLAHPTISDAASSDNDNTGNRFIQNIELDEFGHVTDLTTAVATTGDEDDDNDTFDELEDDTEPKLGGDLDANNKNILMGNNVIEFTNNTITDAKVGQWDTSYAAVYAASGDWNEAHGWGDHADEGYLTSETLTSLEEDSVNQKLIYTDEDGTANDIDLSWCIDDTNLARLTSGSLASNGIATFSRDDGSTFDVDFSQLYDDTNLARIDSASISCGNRQVTFSRDDASTVGLDLSCLLANNQFTSSGLMKTDATNPPNYSIVTDNSENWNTSYGWGDHSQVGYLNPANSERIYNYIPKFTAGDLVKSVITNNGNLVSMAPTVFASTATPNADQQTNKLRLYDVAGNGVAGFGVSTSSFNFATSGAIHQRFFTNTTERMRITHGGDIGIGTSAPDKPVHIDGITKIDGHRANTSNTDPSLILNRVSSRPSIQPDGLTAPNQWLILDSNGGRCALNYFNNNPVVLAHGGGGVGIGVSATPTGYTLRVEGNKKSVINFYGHASHHFEHYGSNNAVLLKCDAGTNRVGISKATPAYKLDVNGNIGADSISLGTAKYLFIGRSSSGQYGRAMINDLLGDIDITTGGMGSNSPTPAIHITNNLVSTNRIGIYKTSPAYGLDVDTDLNVRGSSDVNLLYTDITNNRIGINTSSPIYKFTVVHGSATTGFNGPFGYVDHGGNGDSGWAIKRAGSNKWVLKNDYTDDSFKLMQGGASGTNRMIVSALGEVGIGTTYTSNAKLTVADGQYTKLAIDTGGNIPNSLISLDFIDRHIASNQGVEGQVTAYVRSDRDGNTGRFDLLLGTVHDTTLGGASNLGADADTKIRISSEGFVGIGTDSMGTTDPNTVGGQFGLHLAASRQPEVHFTNNNSGHTAFDGANIQFYASADSNATARLITTNREPGGFIQFYTFNTAGVTKQRISTGPTETTINGIKDNHDFRVLGEVDNYLLQCDANTDTVNIGNTTDNLNTKFYVRADRTNYAAQSGGYGYSRVASVFGRDTVTDNSTNYQAGLNCRAEKKVYSGKTDSGYVIAGNFVALHDYAGTVNEVIGIRSNVGGYTSHNGVITNLYSIKTVPVNQGTGTITNSYGLHLGANPTSTTHSFGIYQSHHGDTNYFAGDSHFSSVAPTKAYNSETIVIQPWKGNPNVYNGITRSDFASSTYMMISDGLNTFVSSNAGGITYLRGPNNGAANAGEIRLKSTEVVINENSTASDFRIESTTLEDFLHQDSSENTIAIYNAVGYGINYATSRGWEQTSSSSNSNQKGYFGGDFQHNGNYVNNYVEHDELPDNSRGLVWKSRNNSPNPDSAGVTDNDYNPDGGWNKVVKGLDPNKAYISIVYVKRVSTNQTGTFYHGCLVSATANMDGSDASNPYFNICPASHLPKDVWCVSIGLIYGYNDPKTSETRSLGGIYRTDTGEKITSLYTEGTNGNRDYRMRSNATQQYHRTYLYYDNTGNTEFDWCWPGFYELDSEYARNFLSLFPSHKFVQAANSTNIQPTERKYVQNIDLDQYGHITNITHAQETVTNTDTQRTNEEIQDIVALMLTTGNHTNISVSYDDADPNGAIDLTGSAGGANNVVRGTVAASNNQTTFSVGGGYTVGAIDVYLNGVKLINGTDFTATDTSAPYNIVLTSAAQSGDTLEYMAFDRTTTAGTLQDTGDTMTGNLTVNADLIVTGYKETHTDNGNTGTAQTIDISDSTVQTYTLNGNCTFTMPTVEAGRSFTMLLKTGAGSFVATFTNVKFPKNTSPTITTDANRMDLITFTCDGTNWYGNAVQDYYV